MHKEQIKTSYQVISYTVDTAVQRPFLDYRW